MSNEREPLLNRVEIASLRPTQMTVGMVEVNAKAERWKKRDKNQQAEYLGEHMIPVVRGPEKRLYVIDHHHLSLALLVAGETHVLIAVQAKLHHLDEDTFWAVLEHRHWVHPYDADGRRRSYKDLPASVRQLQDDPFRSLAGELRRAGGYAKDVTPFSEFLWADFLRRRIAKRDLDADFAKVLKQAAELAKGPEASYLPGWCGAHADA